MIEGGSLVVWHAVRGLGKQCLISAVWASETPLSDSHPQDHNLAKTMGLPRSSTKQSILGNQQELLAWRSTSQEDEEEQEKEEEKKEEEHGGGRRKGHSTRKRSS